MFLQVAFQTKVWHPQIAPDSGKPCVDFLKEQWKPTHGIRDVLVMLRQLLGSPSQSEWRDGGRELVVPYLRRCNAANSHFSVPPVFTCTVSPPAADSVNTSAAAELAQGVEVFEKRAAADTAKYAMD